MVERYTTVALNLQLPNQEHSPSSFRSPAKAQEKLITAPIQAPNPEVSKSC